MHGDEVDTGISHLQFIDTGEPTFEIIRPAVTDPKLNIGKLLFEFSKPSRLIRVDFRPSDMSEPIFIDDLEKPYLVVIGRNRSGAPPMVATATPRFAKGDNQSYHDKDACC